MRTAPRTIVLLLALLVLPAASSAGGDSPASAKRGFDHSVFDGLLRKYVAPDGVRYAEWAASPGDRKALEEYVERLSAGRPSDLPGPDALAFWIDAYNALTLRLILDHYPVESIRDIDSPWKTELITVEDRGLTLDGIENDVIRREWNEPRIHFALNCAAVSCPPLRAEAYTGAGLDAQLEDQTRTFLGNRSFNSVDGKGTLHLSKIFEWYRGDFETEDRSLVDWLRPYLPGLQAIGSGKSPKIEFSDYDWDLNEAKGEEER